MKSIGIDIGTTTISIVVLEDSDFTLVRKMTLPNDSALSSPNPWEHLQDVSRILAKIQAALDEILADYNGVFSIGLTGQMHGIVYLDKSGNAVSPLYTWQDGRGNLPDFQGGMSLCSLLSEEHGVRASSGYGLVTHLYHVKKHLVPPKSVSCCTVADYLGMRLTGRTSPLLHVSQAAGLGLYDVKASCFMRDILKKNRVEPAFLPPVTDEFAVLGSFRGIPVSVSIGDNQASYLGSVRDARRDLLVNIGTGSQISVLSDAYAEGSGIEARPFTKGSCLLVGAALCGGSAYAMLERFFREYAVAVGGADVPQYEVMKRLLEESSDSARHQTCQADKLTVRTTFAGTRENPQETGSITGIRTDNFHPAALIRGVLEGMADELYGLYRVIERESGFSGTRLVASGNGVRKNTALQAILQERFGMPLEIVPYEEEAAFGAAISSLAATGRLSVEQWLGLNR